MSHQVVSTNVSPPNPADRAQAHRNRGWKPPSVVFECRARAARGLEVVCEQTELVVDKRTHQNFPIPAVGTVSAASLDLGPRQNARDPMPFRRRDGRDADPLFGGLKFKPPDGGPSPVRHYLAVRCVYGFEHWLDGVSTGWQAVKRCGKAPGTGRDHWAATAAMFCSDIKCVGA